ncbi:MAG: hypothetical protein ABSD57_02115 [Verrucomicrobiota bacterium]|jgi:hypothetical protein
MNHEPDNQQLLTDVLAEAAPAGFREALLGETLRLARRRRHWRQTRRAAALLVALGLFALLVWQNFPPHSLAPMPMTKVKVQGYELVRTQPLSSGTIVVTEPFSADHLVASVAIVEMVQTSSGNFRVINDDELLALVAPRPAALVRLGPHSEQLFFVNPADEKGFPVNLSVPKS